MARIKRKAKAKGTAASNAPPEVEVTDNNTNAELTPPESVKIETAAAAIILPGGEKMEEELDKKDEVKDDGKVESASKKKNRMIKKTKNNVVAASATTANAAASNDADKPGTPAPEKKALKKESMGLIFMCSAKTKKDCYQYNVFGLPASKKEMVANVYKGMRLFLFDIDLRLMYGIYKAAGPGGYNIEPMAFKSAFPSQVRFSVLNDCLPLPEEKFKAAIKANYYEKNKFNCELSAEQVKNLCKLFQDGTTAPKKKQLGGASRGALSSPFERDRERRPVHDRVRRSTLGGGSRMFPTGPSLYAREAYPRPAALPPMPPPYAYRGAVALPEYHYTTDEYNYRTGVPLDLHDYGIRDLEIRPHDPIEYRDPYSLYREPVLYREPLQPAGLRSRYPAPHSVHYRY